MVTIETLRLTCAHCPVQFVGTLSNGWSLYARSRFNQWMVSVHPDSIEGAIRGQGGFYAEGSLDSDPLDTGSEDDLRARIDQFMNDNQEAWA